MKNFFLLLLLTSYLVHGQTPVEKPVHFLEQSVWRVTYIAPGLVNELRLRRSTTLVTSAQLSGVLGNVGFLRYEPFINSYVSVGGRYFYNIGKCLTNDRRTQSNSANYLMIRTNYTFPPFAARRDLNPTIGVLSGVSVNALWGLQRTFDDKMYVNFAAGIKVAPNGFGLSGNFILGYTLPKSKATHQQEMLKSDD